MFTTLKRILKGGWDVFYRNGEIIAANVFILAITISLITSLFLLRDVSKIMISKIEEKADISVYFKEDVPEKDILGIQDKVAQDPEVKEIRYVSKEDALNSFRERYKDRPTLIESLKYVDRNPFLASLNITAKDASQYESVSNFIEHSEFTNMIEKINYPKRKILIDRIFNITSIVSKIGIILSAILIFVSVLITFNTVRLAVTNFGDEIYIQRLVGASNWFIRGPFIVQGMISGIVAALACLIIFGFAIWYFSPKVEYFFSDVNIFNIFTGNLASLVLIQLAVGVGLGVTSSMAAIARYLKS